MRVQQGLNELSSLILVDWAKWCGRIGEALKYTDKSWCRLSCIFSIHSHTYEKRCTICPNIQSEVKALPFSRDACNSWVGH